jgi:hypothetical protein
MVWRPAIVPTVGVQFLPGFKDEEVRQETDVLAIARGFWRVEYRYHRDFFELLGRSMPARDQAGRGRCSEVAEKFAAIWALCERRMESPHASLVLNRDPTRWVEVVNAACLVDSSARVRFFIALGGVLEREALWDESQGRSVLARMLREVVELLGDPSVG